MGLLVLKKERNIIKDSEIIKDYPRLREFIEDSPNMTDKDLPTLSKEIQLFFKDIYPKVINEAKSEWEVEKGSVDYVEGNKFSCELCGKRPINNICIIENRFTKKRLRIGTDCADGMDNDINLKELLAEKKRIKNIEKINSIFPGIERKIDNWNNIVESQGLYIKKDIKSKYFEYGVRAKEILSIFCKDNTSNKTRKKLIDEMKTLLENSNVERLRIEEYVNSIKDSPFAPKKTLLQSMTESNRKRAIEMLEKDGLIKKGTLWRIRDINYSNNLIELINPKLKIINCVIDSTNTYKGIIGYVIIYNNKKRYKLFCSYSEFCLNFYQLITGEENNDVLSSEAIFDRSKIVDIECLVDASYELLNVIKDSNLRIYETKYTDYSYNELIIKDENLKLYYILKNINDFVNSFKIQLLIGEKDYKNELLDYISQNKGKPYSKEDIDYFLENRR